ncbi:hypothetical protein BJ322DRAFT_8152 [Thelephora terrestris]|uniref:Uncharacterized protein n=1 Tax=Thelephora terrestris TaxID=56493 RepID=A0A9P6HP12_9AGAM|nr:hypothetical protein BJ322DRAFT_8152 [Thelephora terrestris]
MVCKPVAELWGRTCRTALLARRKRMSCPWGHWRIMWPSPSNVQATRLRRLNPRLREKPCRRPRSKSRWPRCPTRAVAEDWWLIPGSQDKIEGIDVGFAQDGGQSNTSRKFSDYLCSRPLFHVSRPSPHLECHSTHLYGDHEFAVWHTSATFKWLPATFAFFQRAPHPGHSLPSGKINSAISPHPGALCLYPVLFRHLGTP